MSVYLANIGLLFIWAFFLLKIKPSEKKRIAFCAIACTQWVLISGLRHWSIGADTLTYYLAFENGRLIPNLEVFYSLAILYKIDICDLL